MRTTLFVALLVLTVALLGSCSGAEPRADRPGSSEPEVSSVRPSPTVAPIEEFTVHSRRGSEDDGWFVTLYFAGAEREVQVPPRCHEAARLGTQLPAEIVVTPSPPGPRPERKNEGIDLELLGWAQRNQAWLAGPQVYVCR